MREAMKSGEERYLPARDRGPVRRFIRDYVDSRVCIGEFMLPLLLAIMFLSWSGSKQPDEHRQRPVDRHPPDHAGRHGLAAHPLKREVRRRFPDESPRGTAFYMLLRVLQLRFMRMPKPQVKLGQKLPEHYSLTRQRHSSIDPGDSGQSTTRARPATMPETRLDQMSRASGGSQPSRNGSTTAAREWYDEPSGQPPDVQAGRERPDDAEPRAEKPAATNHSRFEPRSSPTASGRGGRRDHSGRHSATRGASDASQDSRCRAPDQPARQHREAAPHDTGVDKLAEGLSHRSNAVGLAGQLRDARSRW